MSYAHAVAMQAEWKPKKPFRLEPVSHRIAQLPLRPKLMAAAYVAIFLPLHIWKYVYGSWPVGPTLLNLFNDFFFPYTFLRLAASSAAREKAERELERQLSEFASAKLCAVRLTIRQDGETIAEDEGVAMFSAGMLIYSSGATTFKLKPLDFQGIRSSAGFRLVSDPRFELRFENRKMKGYGAFDSALRVWLDKPPTAIGETVLPPLIPYASVPPTKRWASWLWG